MRTRKDVFPPDLQPGQPRDSDTPEIIKENGGGVSTRRQLMEKLRSEKMRSNKIQEALGGGGAVKRRRQEEEEAGRNLAGVSHTSGKAVNTLNVRERDYTDFHGLDYDLSILLVVMMHSLYQETLTPQFQTS